MTGWIYWSGGVLPVPRDTKVMVRFRDGSQSVEPRPAHYFDVLWRHEGMHRANDVVAYRVVETS